MSYVRSSFGLAALVLTSAASIFVYRTINASEASTTRDLAVTCGAEHRAVVRHAAGQASVAVDCVPAAGLALAGTHVVSAAELAAVQTASGRFLAPQAIPAVYTVPRVDSAVIDAPVVGRVTNSRPVAARESQRKASWKKRALVIGGSAGAGAGIGALIGGKKGALIGAAIGGGGATAVDLARNR